MVATDNARSTTKRNEAIFGSPPIFKMLRTIANRYMVPSNEKMAKNKSITIRYIANEAIDAIIPDATLSLTPISFVFADSYPNWV
jgi:hypothetical protein